MAPEAGFEPAVGCPTSVFETDTFGLSVIPADYGGDSRIRTGDILLAKQALYQLSYIPIA